MRQLRLAIFACLLAAWGASVLRAREIPDLLGRPKVTTAPKPEATREGRLPSKEARGDAPQPQPQITRPGAAPLRWLLPGAMRKSLALPEENGYWVARWIHPDGQESEPIPLWIDREGNGHLFLQATMVLGEEQPPRIRAPRVSACQVLSFFQEPGGGFRPVASDVWIEWSGAEGGAGYRRTGKGRWSGAGKLVAARNVFSPFLSALREAADPEVHRLASFRWPDLALVHHRGNPPPFEESEDAPGNATAE
ncbi:hypothetical protein [Methylacidimicrobium sp. B4]|uniref:hypothetical protein n=1 Tax=Methylacidimicrobium sp. B4 TaxID=2796139 RepID=UPI001A8C2E1D|nr:hypothetical protein [Methylacidimicrobium sp. B4]QSR85035.1 hypothetical protein MacB4_01835 [Methylacidimicrobium sp. B4]